MFCGTQDILSTSSEHRLEVKGGLPRGSLSYLWLQQCWDICSEHIPQYKPQLVVLSFLISLTAISAAKSMGLHC